MKRKILQRFGALVLSMAMSLSLIGATYAEFEDMPCTIPEHTHTEDCYRVPGEKTLVCDPKTHEHVASCYDATGNTSCGYSDQIIHKHDAACYDADDTLICNLPEVFPHVHNSACYIEESILTCDEETGSGHVHGDECYETKEDCICGLDEDETHVHTAECMETRKELICNLPTDAPVHIHDESCYQTKRTLVCREPELTPHLHDASCYSMDGELTCGLVQAIEHRHDESCFDTGEDIIVSEPQCGLKEHVHSAACTGNADEGETDDSTDMSQDDEANPDNEQSDSDTTLGNDGVLDDSAPAYDPVRFAASIRQVRISSISDEFTYKIEGKDITEAVKMPELCEIIGNQGGDIYSFNEIEFTAPGEYTFTIREFPGSNKNIRYDDRTYTLTVNVTDDGTGSLQLESSYMLDSKKTVSTNYATFINTPTSGSNWSPETVQKAEMLMSTMTLEEKVGQLFLLHYPENGSGTSAAASTIINEYHPGGFIVFAQAFENSNPDSFRQKIQETQAASKIPLMISVDEEGGVNGSGNRVVRVSKYPQFRETPFPSPQELKESGGLDAVRTDGIEKAELLTNLGINMNHAPDADVASEGGYMYGRTWGGDGIENSKYVEAAVRAMEESGLGTTIKHFPGYGSTSSDTHYGFAVNKLEKEDFYYNDLLPFNAGIYAGTQAVMVTHNTVNAFDSENPASLSPAIYNLLRNELNFNGLVLTDDLNMGAITNFVGSGNESLTAIKAGADMVITVSANNQIPPVINAVKNGTLSEDRINESCLRVLCWKIEHGVADVAEYDPQDEAAWIPAFGSDMQIGTFSDMWELARENGGTVRLLQNDIYVTGPFYVKSDVTLDLNGKSIKADGSSEKFLFGWETENTLTIKDKGDYSKELTREPAEGNIPGDAEYSNIDKTITYYDIEDAGTDNEIVYRNIVDLSKRGSIEIDKTAMSNSAIQWVFGMKTGKLVLEGGCYSAEGSDIVRMRHSEYSQEEMGGVNIDPNASSPTITNEGGALVGSSHAIHGVGADQIIKGGYIAGNECGIHSQLSSLEIQGGVLAGNNGSNSAEDDGAIYVWHNEVIRISGGLITGNSAKSGGAICITGQRCIDSDIQNREMTGGTLCFNKAENGGAIYIGGLVRPGQDWAIGGYFTISGGQIVHNEASMDGGGVCVDAPNETNNETRLMISDCPVIRFNIGNTATESKTDNIHLKEKRNVVIYIKDALTSGAYIGITGVEGQKVCIPCDIKDVGRGFITEEDMIYLHSDNENLFCSRIGNEVYLYQYTETVNMKIHDVKIDFSGEMEDCVKSVQFPKGHKLGDFSINLDSDGSNISLVDCKLYFNDGNTPFTEIEEPIVSDIELWTYRWDLVLKCADNEKTIKIREAQPIDPKELIINEIDVSGLWFFDQDGSKVSIDNVLSGSVNTAKSYELDIQKIDESVYLIRSDGYVNLTIHDITHNVKGIETDRTEEVRFPKYYSLNDFPAKIGHNEPDESDKPEKADSSLELLSDCRLYTQKDSKGDLFDNSGKVTDNTELWTYIYEAVFFYRNGSKTVTGREGQKLEQDALTVNNLDVTTLNFKDEQGNEVPFKSLSDGLTRSYDFVNFKIEDKVATGSDRVTNIDTYFLKGSGHYITLPVKDGYGWTINGINKDKFIREFKNEELTLEGVTFKAIDEPVLVYRYIARREAAIYLYVMLDGKPTQVGVTNAVHGPALFDGTERRYVLLNEIAEKFKPYGFNADTYKGEQFFANTNGTNQKEIYTDANPYLAADGWRIPIALSADGNLSYDECWLLYLPNKMPEGYNKIELANDKIAVNNNMWTIKIEDKEGESGGCTDIASKTAYVLDGGEFSIELPSRTAEWTIKKGAKVLVTKNEKDSESGAVSISLGQIHSSVTIECGNKDHVKYTVQYYAYCNDIDWDASGTAITMINTDRGQFSKDGGILPNNSYYEIYDKEPRTNAFVKKLSLKDGKIATKLQLKSIYKQKEYYYNLAPTLFHVDRLYMDENYYLDSLWVLKEGKLPTSINPDDWTIFHKEDFADLNDLRKLVMTNDPSFAEGKNNVVLVENDTVMRFVYGAEIEKRETDVQFYDYDITDGHIYFEPEKTKPEDTSKQKDTDKVYVNTKQQGINNPKNYTKGGSKFAFGNGNTNSGLNNEKIDNTFWFNQANRYSEGPWNNRTVFWQMINLCCFGLVKGLDADGNIEYNDNISVPNLFNEGPAIGKTPVDGFELVFDKNGDNYEFSGLKKNGNLVMDNLNVLKDIQGTWSNNFWPMDYSETYGASNHDLKFGNTEFLKNRNHGGGTMPASDDYQDHNSYFGMTFKINFTIPQDYEGNLDYCFFGDDDMWVFLDGRLILDIGGVHRSVGEYVNLWNYIEQGADVDENGDPIKHTLSFFYTERGASGSTCWMKYTLPYAEFIEGGQFVPFKNMRIEKHVTGDDIDPFGTYDFNISFMNEKDEIVGHSFMYTRFDKDGNAVEYDLIEKGQGIITLKADEAVEIYNIHPEGIKFKISEKQSPTYITDITMNGEPYTDSSEMGTIEGEITEDSPKDIMISYTNQYKELPELPETGGKGIYNFYWGALLIAIAVIGTTYGLKRRKKKV